MTACELCGGSGWLGDVDNPPDPQVPCPNGCQDARVEDSRSLGMKSETISHRQVYVLRRCPLCKSQCEGTSWSSHYADCPNLGKAFAVEEVYALTLDDAVAALETGYAPQSPTFHHPADWLEQWFGEFASTTEEGSS